MQNKISFYLDRPKSDAPTYIFLKYACADGGLKYSAQVSVYPSQWDTVNQQSTDRTVNAAINKIYTVVEKYVEHCRIMGNQPVYKTDLAKELDEALNRQERAKNGTSHFFETIDLLISEAEQGRLLTPKRTKYTPGSCRGYRRSRNRLYDFDKHMEFNAITIQTYYNFINWCNNRNYALNYISALIKDWKTFMSWSMEKGFHKNLVASGKEFKRVEEESFQIYLSDTEIMALLAYDLSGKKVQEVIRDRFIVNLYSGLRISDMKTLTIKNINLDKNTITHINKKTSKRVVMPIHPAIIAIIEKYNGDLPRQYVAEFVNKEIKKIAQAAGFTEMVTFSKTIGGRKHVVTKEKWEMVSNHTARRSMTTNLLKATDMQSVMPVLGMSLKTIQKYNKRSGDENAAMLQGNSFFSK